MLSMMAEETKTPASRSEKAYSGSEIGMAKQWKPEKNPLYIGGKLSSLGGRTKTAHLMRTTSQDGESCSRP
ncbi:unnamed protein product [Ilex paraguariensis]|uniref:Uncharacterized protein n=1 Tax=Ilex paraguariensis TaxID=185542 RepID=A0ABC8TFG8_9AQUA